MVKKIVASILILSSVVWFSLPSKDIGSRASKEESRGIYRVDNPFIGSGTAFVIARNENLGKTLLLTNDHLCTTQPNELSSFLYLTASDDIDNPVIAHPLFSDTYVDLCAIEADTLLEGDFHLSAYPILSVGDVIKTVGYPLGVEEARQRSARFFSIERYDDDLAHTNMGIFYGKAYGGQSGSPILNRQGRVIGILSRGDSRNTTLFVPSDVIIKFLTEHLN